jgi:hypothetical protein
VLVHPDRGGENSGADVAHARHLQQALDGAVLTPRPVQQREDDVDLAELVRHGGRVVHHQLAAAPLTGKADRGAGGVDLRQLLSGGDREPVRVVGLEHPPAVVGDADRHHVVPLRVDGREHAARRRTGHRVLAGPAAEDHGDARLASAHLPVRGLLVLLAHGEPTLPVRLSTSRHRNLG